MGFKRFSHSKICSQIPLPTGEGAPSSDGRPCEGYNTENSSKTFEEMNVVPLTRPADAGHPLPSGEGFVPGIFPIWTAQPLQGLSYCPWLGGQRHSETVTRRKVAGMDVPPLPLLVFCAFARPTSCWWRSSTLPFFSAASYAFIVGP